MFKILFPVFPIPLFSFFSFHFFFIYLRFQFSLCLFCRLLLVIVNFLSRSDALHVGTQLVNGFLPLLVLVRVEYYAAA